MKVSSITQKTVFFLCVLITILLCTLLVAAADEPTRVAVLPFKINAEKDLSFLRDGIFDMLSSRLTVPGKVQVFSKSESTNALETLEGPIDEAAARKIGITLGADYVLFGSLTVFGNSLSLDASMVDVSAARPTLTFFNQSQDMGEVIPRISQFAAEINQRAFGRTVVVKTAPIIKPVQPQQPPQPDVHSHPEELLEDSGVEKDAKKGQDAPLAPSVMSRKQQMVSPNFWKSRNFSYLINGLAVGDLDADDRNETVIVTAHEVRVYRSENRRFIQINQPAEKKRNNYIGVDVADINGNGYAEIFVTSYNKLKNALSSLVVEFDGKNYNTIVENSPWYYRVSDLPDGRKILLGQKNRSGSPFGGDIFEMIWQNSEYIPEKQIKTPRKINLLGFSLGNVLNDGQETAVSYGDDNRMVVVTPSGEVIWKGDKGYGGSTLYYAAAMDNPGEVENKIYLPMRVLVRNKGAGVKSEVIAVKNYETMEMKWERRHFTDAHIESFSWDGLGLATNWKTHKFSGHIRDFAVADFDNDGQDELVAAVILKEG
ncbi:MAG: VCBS repeat-containing protein, partial [Deltaproteobacteria bacterium]